jgi:hypothetical protein
MDMKINVAYTLMFMMIIFCLYKFKGQIDYLENETCTLRKKVEDLDIEDVYEEDGNECVTSVSDEEKLLVDKANAIIDDSKDAQKDKSI